MNKLKNINKINYNIWLVIQHKWPSIMFFQSYQYKYKYEKTRYSEDVFIYLWICQHLTFQFFKPSTRLLLFKVFGLLSSSLLLYSQHFGWYVLWSSSGVCRTWEPTWNFEPRPLFNPQELLVLILLNKGCGSKFCVGSQCSINTWRRLEDISAETLWI